MSTHIEGASEEKVGRTGGRRIQCVVVTPERTWLDALVDSVVLPADDGELGVLHGHSPLVARLGHGELRTTTNDTVNRYFVDGGFAQVRDNVVTILTHHAMPAAQVDTAVASAELERAESLPATSDHQFGERQRAFARARGMLRVARHR
jgi:F-type H+-transporting ATPase subunit epsilon